MCIPNINEVTVKTKSGTEILIEKIPTLESELALCRSDNERLEHQIDNLKEQRDEIKEKINYQSKQIDDLSDKITEAYALISQLKSEKQKVVSDVEEKVVPENENLFYLVGSYMIKRKDGTASKINNKRFTLDIYKKLIAAGYLTKTSLKNLILSGDIYAVNGIGISRAKALIKFINNDFKTVYTE